MRIGFYEIFNVDSNGMIRPRGTILVNGVTMTSGVSFGAGVSFGGLDFNKIKGKDLEAEYQPGMTVVKGYYD